VLLLSDLRFDDPLTGGVNIPETGRSRRDRPGKIVCIGRNYREHAKELGNEVPAEPLVFLKPSTSVIGDGEPIVLPPQSERVEFEGEIGIVIGKRLTRATEAEATAAIGGIVALNDVTARDLQRKDSQWTRAKGFDSFCPMGNVVDAPEDLTSLTVITRVNGEERQRGSVRDLVFPIPMLLSYVSQIMTLEPGDILATGTPSGVGPLAPGDTVEIEIEGFSKVSNPVTAQA
jgi:2-keto-4-pentenoate hydratase/2-oxohepta-3-ene-1,7-dioic acid hydratase in catechol pathway